MVLTTHCEKHFNYTSPDGFNCSTKVSTQMGKLTPRYDYTFRGRLAWRQEGNRNLTKLVNETGNWVCE